MTKLPVIGILGGGQLGRMLQEQAALVGIELAILDEESCPARQICQSDKHVTGSFKDPDKIRELARRCDVLTVEIEHINTEVLEEIATVGVDVGGGQRKKVPCHPSWQTLRLIQDKYLQKEHFAAAGLPIVPQLAIDGGDLLASSLKEAADAFGFPFMLKARKGSYDGRGNFKVNGPKDFPEVIKVMGHLPLYAEMFQPFDNELAVMVVRTEDDHGALRDVIAYPVVQTEHEDSICTQVHYPPRLIRSKDMEKARRLAADVVRTLIGRGVFAVEMFRIEGKEEDQLIINEVAPRPHNSGHYTIEAVPYMSQYKAQLYSILDTIPRGIKLEATGISSATMINILGGANEDSHDKLVEMVHLFYDPDMAVFLHLYGKSSKPGRKIGHITAVLYGDDSGDFDDKVSAFSSEASRIRQERIDASSAQMRPGDVALGTATTASAAPAPASTSASAAVAAQQQPSSTSTTTPSSSHSSSSSRSVQNPLVVVTMGSDSDLGVLRGAFDILERFHVPYDFTITSAHRTPHLMSELARAAAGRGVRVIIAAAGGAAALPGMVASETPLPVIGVPVKATHLDGKDSLLSIVQMPRGCPVATVGINNSTNAALLAVKILGTGDEGYRRAMEGYMRGLSDEVEVKARRLGEIGWKAYLGDK